MLFFPLINVKMPTIVGILTFMSRKKKFMLSSIEHEKSFITSGPLWFNNAKMDPEDTDSKANSQVLERTSF